MSFNERLNLLKSPRDNLQRKTSEETSTSKTDTSSSNIETRMKLNLQKLTIRENELMKLPRKSLERKTCEKISTTRTGTSSSNMSFNERLNLLKSPRDNLQRKTSEETSTSKTDTSLSNIETRMKFVNLQKLMIQQKKKKKLLSKNLPPSGVTQQVQRGNPCMIVTFYGLLIFFAMILSSIWDEINESPFDFTNASLELRKNVYGQDDAINQLISHYEENVDTFDVVVLVGGTGTGKSYTGKIITKHFPHVHNIFEYSPPLRNDREAAYRSLSSMHCNLVIFENLEMYDLEDLVSFVKLLYNRKPPCCTKILAIMNPEVTDENLIKTMHLEESLDEIDFAFSTEKIPVKTINFKPLTSDIIDICIKNEAKERDIALTDEQLQEIRRHLLSTNSGCKGAYAKVQLYVGT